MKAYDVAWAMEFEREATCVLNALTERIDTIEHIGSTVLPGMQAKPIIDLAARDSGESVPFDLETPLAEIENTKRVLGPKDHAFYLRRGAAGTVSSRRRRGCVRDRRARRCRAARSLCPER
ncbi:GrpB family protein [Arthrobacter sp. R1-13]